MRDINLPKLVPRPLPVDIFPTAGSLKDAIEFARMRLPDVPWNTLHTVLLVYHNTLLNELKKARVATNPTEFD